MKTIWKYKLKVERIQEIELPKNAEILSADVINNIGYLWAKVDKDTTEKEVVRILTVPTGSSFNENGEYLGTNIYNKGEIVQHIFLLN